MPLGGDRDMCSTNPSGSRRARSRGPPSR